MISIEELEERIKAMLPLPDQPELPTTLPPWPREVMLDVMARVRRLGGLRLLAKEFNCNQDDLPKVISRYIAKKKKK